MADDVQIVAIRTIVYKLLQQGYNWDNDITRTMTQVFRGNEYQLDGLLRSTQFYLKQQNYIFDYDMNTFIPTVWQDTPPDLIIDIDKKTTKGASPPHLLTAAETEPFAGAQAPAAAETLAGSTQGGS